MRRLAIFITVFACVVGACVVVAASAFAVSTGPQWTVTSVSEPTNFKPGDMSGENAFKVVVTNTGGETSGAGEPVTITDELPAGLSPAPAGASGVDQLVEATSKSNPGAKFTCGESVCTFTGAVVPDEMLVVTFPVDVTASAEETVDNIVRVKGGGAPDASMITPTVISESPAGFGVSPGGAVTALSDTQAGAHPDFTGSLSFNTVGSDKSLSLAGSPKEDITELPPGFAGDLVDTPTCSAAQFERSECPIDTQVGISTVSLLGAQSVKELLTQAIYNLSPNPGEVAKIGFRVAGNKQIQGNVRVRPGDYGITVAFSNINEAETEIQSATLTVWGVPAAAIHDTWRWKPEGLPPLGSFGASSEIPPAPYFTNPTSCEGTLETISRVTSWEGGTGETASVLSPIVGCDRLSLPASFTAVPTTESAEAPTGLDLNMNVEQTYENAEGLASSTLNQAVVALPEGMTANPSFAAGLGACSLSEYEEEALEESTGRGCPNDSKLGKVKIETPVLRESGVGSVFLAEPAPAGEAGRNPFNSLLALYVVARFPERGVLVKVAGKVTPNPVTGQLVTTFANQPALGGLPGLGGLPPVPFSSFTFEFDQGQTAPLATPPVCGSYDVTSALNPWSEPERSIDLLAPAFSITHGPVEGSPCPSGGVPPFSPQVIAGSEDNDAGDYSPFYLRIVRENGEQEITKFTTVLPPGLTGNLTGIPFCPEADIEAARKASGTQEIEHPSCPVASEIGHSLVGAGVGNVLAQAPGKIYLAGPYHGSPLSVVAITAAKVGPFDLGTVVVRFALNINPITAQAEINGANSDPIPHIIDGIVVHVRDIRAYIDRSKFVLNPTSCDRMSIAETVTGAGANYANPADQVPVTVTSPYQAADCSNLKFTPTFKVSTSGKTSRAEGASLIAKVSYPAGALGKQANIAKFKVDLPKQLPSRLTTLQKACTAAQFNANPAGCPAASKVGYAKTITPIIPVPVEGPAYFVSHGNEAFPNLIFVLEGYGIRVDIVGTTFISKAGITSDTLKTVPDIPFNTFQATFPQGKYSALAAIGNLCKSKLAMPTAFVAQDGAEIHESTKIAVTNCPKIKKTKKHKKAKKPAAK